MWKAMGNVWKVWRGVWKKNTQPPTPVSFRSKYPLKPQKDDNIVVGVFIFLEYMIAFIQ